MNKKLRVMLLVGCFVALGSFAAANASANDDLDIEALASKMLKESGDYEEPKPKDPNKISGILQCGQLKIFLNDEWLSFSIWDTNYSFFESERTVDKNGDINVGYKFADNPAVVDYLVFKKNGKEAYMRDRLKFSKLYKCKPAN